MVRRWLVRFVVLGLAAAAVWWWRQQQVATTGGETPAPPRPVPAPAPGPSPSAPAPSAPAPSAPAPSAPAWKEPVDGACPDGYPIKVNAKSGIFHEPGGRSYDRTVPERCYATAAGAEADGYRRAKA